MSPRDGPLDFCGGGVGGLGNFLCVLFFPREDVQDFLFRHDFKTVGFFFSNGGMVFSFARFFKCCFLVQDIIYFLG